MVFLFGQIFRVVSVLLLLFQLGDKMVINGDEECEYKKSKFLDEFEIEDDENTLRMHTDFSICNDVLLNYVGGQRYGGKFAHNPITAGFNWDSFKGYICSLGIQSPQLTMIMDDAEVVFSGKEIAWLKNYLTGNPIKCVITLYLQDIAFDLEDIAQLYDNPSWNIMYNYIEVYMALYFRQYTTLHVARHGNTGTLSEQLEDASQDAQKAYNEYERLYGRKIDTIIIPLLSHKVRMLVVVLSNYDEIIVTYIGPQRAVQPKISTCFRNSLLTEIKERASYIIFTKKKWLITCNREPKRENNVNDPLGTGDILYLMHQTVKIVREKPDSSTSIPMNDDFYHSQVAVNYVLFYTLMQHGYCSIKNNPGILKYKIDEKKDFTTLVQKVLQVHYSNIQSFSQNHEIQENAISVRSSSENSVATEASDFHMITDVLSISSSQLLTFYLCTKYDIYEVVGMKYLTWQSYIPMTPTVKDFVMHVIDKNNESIITLFDGDEISSNSDEVVFLKKYFDEGNMRCFISPYAHLTFDLDMVISRSFDNVILKYYLEIYATVHYSKYRTLYVSGNFNGSFREQLNLLLQDIVMVYNVHIKKDMEPLQEVLATIQLNESSCVVFIQITKACVKEEEVCNNQLKMYLHYTGPFIEEAVETYKAEIKKDKQEQKRDREDEVIHNDHDHMIKKGKEEEEEQLQQQQEAENEEKALEKEIDYKIYLESIIKEKVWQILSWEGTLALNKILPDEQEMPVFNILLHVSFQLLPDIERSKPLSLEELQYYEKETAYIFWMLLMKNGICYFQDFEHDDSTNQNISKQHEYELRSECMPDIDKFTSAVHREFKKFVSSAESSDVILKWKNQVFGRTETAAVSSKEQQQLPEMKNILESTHTQPNPVLTYDSDWVSLKELGLTRASVQNYFKFIGMNKNEVKESGTASDYNILKQNIQKLFSEGKVHLSQGTEHEVALKLDSVLFLLKYLNDERDMKCSIDPYHHIMFDVDDLIPKLNKILPTGIMQLYIEMYAAAHWSGYDLFFATKVHENVLLPKQLDNAITEAKTAYNYIKQQNEMYALDSILIPLYLDNEQNIVILVLDSKSVVYVHYSKLAKEVEVLSKEKLEEVANGIFDKSKTWDIVENIFEMECEDAEKLFIEAVNSYTVSHQGNFIFPPEDLVLDDIQNNAVVDMKEVYKSKQLLYMSYDVMYFAENDMKLSPDKLFYNYIEGSFLLTQMFFRTYCYIPDPTQERNNTLSGIYKFLKDDCKLKRSIGGLIKRSSKYYYYNNGFMNREIQMAYEKSQDKDFGRWQKSIKTNTEIKL